MFPCAVAAAASTDPTARVVAAFYYDPGGGGPAIPSAALRTYGARDGDFLIIDSRNLALSSGGTFSDPSTEYFTDLALRYRRLNAADVAGTLSGYDGTFVVILRGAVDDLVPFSSSSDRYLLGPGHKSAAGTTKSPGHAGFLIWGSVYVDDTPAFTAPSGIVQLIRRFGLDTTRYVFARLSPPAAPYPNGTDFVATWPTDGGQNQGGDFLVLELRHWSSGGGSAPPLLPTGVLSSGVWDDGGVWDDADTWRDS